MTRSLSVARRVAAAAALGLCLAAGPAEARQDNQGAEFQSYRIPGWTFTPAVAFGVIRDSNVALVGGGAGRAVDTQGDAVFTIVPSGQLEFLGKRTEFSAGYRGFLRRYADVEGLDAFDQRATLGFRRLATRRLTLFASNNFASSPTTDEIEVNGVPFRRTGSRLNTAAAGADVRLTKFTNLSARYDVTWVDFERSEQFSDLTGGWIHALRGEVTRQITSRVAAGGEYSYRTASLDRGEREFGFQDAGGVVRVALGPHTSGSVAGGYAALHDRVDRETRTGPYVRMSVAHTLEYARLGAGYERVFVPSFGFGGASSSQEVRAHALVPLWRRRLYLQNSVAWRRTDPFEQERALALDTTWLRSTLGYAAARWGRVEALYTYTRQDSVVTGGEVDRHRVGVQFVVSQPVRIP